MRSRTKEKVQVIFVIIFCIGLALFWAWKLPTLDWHWLWIAVILAVHFMGALIVALAIVELVDQHLDKHEDIKKLKNREKVKSDHEKNLYEKIDNKYTYDQKHIIREKMLAEEKRQEAIKYILQYRGFAQDLVKTKSLDIEVYNQQLKELGYESSEETSQ